MLVGCACCLFLAGCKGEDPSSDPDAGAPDADVTGGCPEGFRLRPGVGVSGCEPILPGKACTPGSMPRIGASSCQPVGWTACPSGFKTGANGWGCIDQLANSPCTGATIEVLGQSGCAPLGACTGTFPPAGATHFVDDSYSDGQLDATHFRSIGAALTAAPAGATVAVEAGTYAESLTFGRPVKLVGRCPDQVVLKGALAAPGLTVSATKDVSVKGLTITGHLVGARVEKGGGADLEQVVLSANQDLGLAVWDATTVVTGRQVAIRGTLSAAAGGFGWGISVEGGKLELDDSVLGGNRGMGMAVTKNGTGRLVRSVVRETAANNTGAGVGVVAQDGGAVELDSSVLTGNVQYGLLANIGHGRASVSRTVIRDTAAAGGNYGRAVQVDSGGEATLTEVTLVQNRELALSVEGKGSKVTMKRASILETQPGAGGIFGVGAGVQQGGRLSLEETAVVGSRYYGLFVADAGSEIELDRSLVQDTRCDTSGQFGRGIEVVDGGKVTLRDSALLGNREYGVFVAGAVGGKRAEAVVSSSLIRDTTAIAAHRGGVGVAVQSGARAELDRSALIDNQAVSLFISDGKGGSGEACEAKVSRSLIGPTLPAPDGSQGAAVVCGAPLTMASSVVTGSHGFGILVANPGSSASLVEVVVDNTVVEKDSGEYGHGLVGGAGSVIELDGCELTDNAGVGMAFSGGSGVVAACVIARNKVGAHVQGGSKLVESASKPASPVAGQVIVTTDTQFVDNLTRVGSGEISLPTFVAP